MITRFKIQTLLFVIISICVALYLVFAYDLERTNYLKLITLYSLLFGCFLILINYQKENLKLLVVLSFVFRVLFLLAIPNLSQDFYRFLWDGRLLAEGINPYLFTPLSYAELGNSPIAQAQILIDGMGSLNASHYSNYAPINQLCFYIAGLFSGNNILGSVVILRLLIIAADAGTLFFGYKLLKNLKLPVYHIYWFILNPFIIIELTGNLHFEGVMIFFLVWGLYLLYKRQWLYAGIILGLSISAKLIPLMFLPVFLKWFQSKQQQSLSFGKLIGFYLTVMTTTILTFLPFYNASLFDNYSKTIGLYFQNFEFNASLYYLARAVGYAISGYNQIAIIGKIIPIVVVLVILGITFYRKNYDYKSLVASLLFCISFYFFTATTVHPWYIATVLILSVFTNYKFPVLWSFVVMLSYLTYFNNDNLENFWVLLIQYGCLYSFFIWEVFIRPKNAHKKPFQKLIY